MSPIRRKPTVSCLLLAVLFGGTAAAQLTRDQKIADFLTVANAYGTSYGPYEWKKETQNFDLLQLQPWIDKVSATTSDTEFAEVLVDFVASLNDAHDSISFPFFFQASLPLSVDIYDGVVLIESVSRARLPAAEFPFTTGDELVSMDGRPVAEWIQQFRKYAIAANQRSTNRMAATMLVNRPQAAMPSLTTLADTATVEVRRAGGAVESYEIPWIKYGEPGTTFGRLASPTGRAAAAAAPSAVDVTFDDTLPLHMQPMAQFLQARVRADRYAVLNFGSRNPIYRLPDGFELRLGRLSSDFFLSGTFPAAGLKIGYIRIPSFSPSSASLAYSQFEQEMAYFQANTDGLIIDDMRNPGGTVAFVEGLAQRVIPYQFRTLGFEIRATTAWVYSMEGTSVLAHLTGQPSWAVAALDANLDQVRQANSEVRGRTGPLSLNSTGTLQLLPHPVAYKKPVMVLVDEFSASGGDMFPAILQDNKRALIYGYRTMGAGGNVVGYDVGSYSQASFSVTGSLMNRIAPVSSPGLPEAPYIENIGVQPDIVADYMTRDNLMNGGRTFVQGFTAAMVDYINKSKQ